MDVGYFISELLGQHAEVNVPGLGYFAHTRVNGYYNESEGKFYPPGYNVQFDPQFIEDETLTQYIADNKNISLASSKYFTEKFVANLKYLAATGEVALADIGYFYTDQYALTFRSNNNLSTDPEFFGYPAITLHKIGHIPAAVEAAPAIAHVQRDVNVPQFETDEEHEAYLVDLTAKRRRKTLWTFVILALLFAALIVYLVNKYDRSVFDLEKKPVKANTPASKKAPAPKRVLVVDSSKAASDADTIIVAKKGGAIDSIAIKAKDTVTIPAGPHFEIMGGSFSTLTEANRAISNYKSIGFTARILENVPGRKKKVTLGSFSTRQQAIEAQQKILNTGKIKSASMYIQQYHK